MDGYVFSPYVDARAIGTHYPKDVCGAASAGVNYCAMAMHLMTVSVAFTQTGKHLLVAKMLGGVDYYNVTDPDGNGTLAFEGPSSLLEVDSFDIGGLREYGLTGLTLDKETNLVFVSVTGKFEGSATHQARIYRFQLTAHSDGALVSSGRTVIYERTDPKIYANAHNLHGGLTFGFDASDGSGPRRGLVVSFGDLNDHTNPYKTGSDYGKMLLMDFNGSAFDTAVFDTGHAHNNMHLAIGNRNAFWLRRLAPTCDTSERVVWGENGDSYQRAVLYSLLEPGHAHDLEWRGWDNPGWFRLVDPHKGSNAVLFTSLDSAGVVVEPFSMAERIWESAGVPDGRGYVLHSYMTPQEGDQARMRSITLEVLGNLNSAPQPAGYAVVEVLAQAEKGEYASAPMAMAIHEQTGSFVYADVFTGNLAHLYLHNMSALINAGPPLAACDLPPRFTPMGVVFRDNAVLIVICMSTIVALALLSWGALAYFYLQLRTLRKQHGNPVRLRADSEKRAAKPSTAAFFRL